MDQNLPSFMCKLDSEQQFYRMNVWPISDTVIISPDGRQRQDVDDIKVLSTQLLMDSSSKVRGTKPMLNTSQ